VVTPIKKTYLDRYREWVKTTAMVCPYHEVVALFREADEEIRDIRKTARNVQSPPGAEDYSDVE
jgi:hypothetical protein